MVRVNPTPKKKRNPIITVVAVVSFVIGIGWLIASSFLRSSPSDEKLTLRGGELSQSSAAIGEGNSIIGITQLSAPSMLKSKRPFLIYGTAWKKEQTASLVLKAIEHGFRFIDTACQPKHYNEAGVGEGWTSAATKLGLKRSDFFLQTKFTSIDGQDRNNIPYDQHATLEEQVKQSLTVSLHNLQTDYIDSLVMHSPMRSHEETLRVWRVMESFVKEGTAKQLGVANFYDTTKFLDLYEDAHIKPKVLQNRFYSDSDFDINLRSLCDSYGILYQSFWTLTANIDAIRNPDWVGMATSKNMTPETLMYAYMMAQGHTPLDGTKNVQHMDEDVEVMLRFQNGEQVLTKDEVDKLSFLLGAEDD
jgi:diketogulonate reductase-like aldo/keto reductase